MGHSFMMFTIKESKLCFLAFVKFSDPKKKEGIRMSLKIPFFVDVISKQTSRVSLVEKNVSKS